MDMRKPTGVVVAAVLLVLLALYGTATLLLVPVVLAIMPSPAPNAHAATVIAGAVSVALIGLPTVLVWCVAIGLFRGRNWARIGGVVLGALIALGGLFLALCMTFAMQSPRLREQGTSPHQVFIFSIVFALGMTAFGLWLAVYLNTAPVKRAFRPVAPQAALGDIPTAAAFDPPPYLSAVPPDHPADRGSSVARVVVLLFAAFSLLGALSMSFMAALRLPLIFPGVTLSGHAAALAMVVIAAINTVIAIGLYRRFQPAYYCAIATQGLAIVSALALLIPSYRNHALAALSGRFAPPASPQMAAMQHTLQSVMLLAEGVLIPCLGVFFIWALLRDLTARARRP